MQTIDSSQAMRDQRPIRWALRSGAAAAIRAALILLFVFSPPNFNLVFVAASAFIVTAPITWKLLQSVHQPGWLSAGLAGLLCAVIPHPLFWIAHDLTYGPIDFFGRSNILQECILSLLTVGMVTIPASIFSTIVMVARYQKPSTSINTASAELHPTTWRLARTPRLGISIFLVLGAVVLASGWPGSTSSPAAFVHDSLHLITTLNGAVSQNGQIEQAAFARDSTHLLLISNGVVHVADIRTGHILLTITPHTGTLIAARYSPNDQRIVTVSARGMESLRTTLWSTSGLPIADVAGSFHRFIQNGTQFVTVSEQAHSFATLYIWDATSGAAIRSSTCTFEGHIMAISPDGMRAIVSDYANAEGRQNRMRLVATDSWAMIADLRGSGAVPNMDWTLIATLDHMNVRIYRADTGSETLTFRGTLSQLEYFDMTGTQLIATTNGDMATVGMWNVRTRVRSYEMPGSKPALSGDSHYLATVLPSGRVQVHDLHANTPVANLRPGSERVWGVAFSPDSHYLITVVGPALDRTTTQVWDLQQPVLHAGPLEFSIRTQ